LFAVAAVLHSPGEFVIGGAQIVLATPQGVIVSLEESMLGGVMLWTYA
jgi:hypothetical protein